MNSKTFLPSVYATALLAVALTPAVASSKPTSAELAAITERGCLLAEYDTAAWRATDAVLASHPSGATAGRYIARKTEAGWKVDFGRLNAAGDRFLVAYEAIETGSSERFEIKNFDPVREDSDWNLIAAKGIETATRDFGRANRPYNLAVLPAENGSIYVYLYPAQVREGVYPLGADVRYRVSADGAKIIEKRQMHKSIIESAPVSADVKVARSYHTHVLSDLPEDTDVLFVLTRQPKMPEMVLAGPYMYTVDVSGNISVATRPK